MILVSGASGKTGSAVLHALARKNLPARALVHRDDQIEAAGAAGAVDAIRGDLGSLADLEQAMAGVEKVYHICPNMHPDELPIAMRVVTAAKKMGVGQIVYHSVLHPQIEGMPHHWNKMRVEEYLFTCGLPYTILQPCAYMQNISAYLPAVIRDGIYAVPYAPETRISIVDLEDVAAAAVRVLSEPGHEGAIYELVGPQPLSQAEVAAVLERVLARPVRAQAVGLDNWIENAKRGGMASYMLETLVKMFVYYEQNGFSGNSRVLEWVLERPATTFETFARRLVSGENSHG
jgi:uncharacterized protein YbjT (DUF2867 family)